MRRRDGDVAAGATRPPTDRPDDQARAARTSHRRRPRTGRIRGRGCTSSAWPPVGAKGGVRCHGVSIFEEWRLAHDADAFRDWLARAHHRTTHFLSEEKRCTSLSAYGCISHGMVLNAVACGGGARGRAWPPAVHRGVVKPLQVPDSPYYLIYSPPVNLRNRRDTRPTRSPGVSAPTVAGIESETCERTSGISTRSMEGPVDPRRGIPRPARVVRLGEDDAAPDDRGAGAPTSGEIHIGDQRVDGDVPPRARGIAMVFQSYALYPHRTCSRTSRSRSRRADAAQADRGEGAVGRPRCSASPATSTATRAALGRGTPARRPVPRLVRTQGLLLDEPRPTSTAKLRNTARDD